MPVPFIGWTHSENRCKQCHHERGVNEAKKAKKVERNESRHHRHSGIRGPQRNARHQQDISSLDFPAIHVYYDPGRFSLVPTERT